MKSAHTGNSAESIVELYRPDVKGCMDGNCIFQDNSVGMHTNGGCSCERELVRTPEGLKMEEKVMSNIKETSTQPQTVSDAEIEQVAADESPQDWGRLEYASIYREAFVDGAQWMRERDRLNCGGNGDG